MRAAQKAWSDAIKNISKAGFVECFSSIITVFILFHYCFARLEQCFHVLGLAVVYANNRP